MLDTELLMHLAEIAGIFVGFGALIAIRSESTRDDEVSTIRQLVVLGIVVVIVAIFPVILAGFGVTGHGLWATSAGVFLVLFWGSGILNLWDVERTKYLRSITLRERMRFELPLVPLWLFMMVALVLILMGQIPELEPALYLAAVAASVVLTAATLLILVYLQRRPDPDATEDVEFDLGVDTAQHDDGQPAGSVGEPRLPDTDALIG